VALAAITKRFLFILSKGLSEQLSPVTEWQPRLAPAMQVILVSGNKAQRVALEIL
jgi:hypothetical protein